MCIGGRRAAAPALQQRTTPEVKPAPADESAKSSGTMSMAPTTHAKKEQPKPKKEEPYDPSSRGATAGIIDTSDTINY